MEPLSQNFRVRLQFDMPPPLPFPPQCDKFMFLICKDEMQCIADVEHNIARKFGFSNHSLTLSIDKYVLSSCDSVAILQKDDILCVSTTETIYSDDVLSIPDKITKSNQNSDKGLKRKIGSNDSSGAKELFDCCLAEKRCRKLKKVKQKRKRKVNKSTKKNRVKVSELSSKQQTVVKSKVPTSQRKQKFSSSNKNLGVNPHSLEIEQVNRSCLNGKQKIDCLQPLLQIGSSAGSCCHVQERQSVKQNQMTNLGLTNSGSSSSVSVEHKLDSSSMSSATSCSSANLSVLVNIHKSTDDNKKHTATENTISLDMAKCSSNACLSQVTSTDVSRDAVPNEKQDNSSVGSSQGIHVLCKPNLSSPSSIIQTLPCPTQIQQCSERKDLCQVNELSGVKNADENSLSVKKELLEEIPCSLLVSNNDGTSYGITKDNSKYLDKDVKIESLEKADGTGQSVENYESLPFLSWPPRIGDVIAFKQLEMSSDYSPEISSYKEAEVLKVCSGHNRSLEVKQLWPPKAKPLNPSRKFEIIFDSDEEQENITDSVFDVSWISIFEPRLIRCTRHCL